MTYDELSKIIEKVTVDTFNANTDYINTYHEKELEEALANNKDPIERVIKSYLHSSIALSTMTTIQTLENSLVEIAAHSSERERAAVDAEREVLDMKMAEYMEDHIGEEYDGVISTITNFGFFVALPNLIEGLVHVQTLKGDYYSYVPELLSMIGKSTKKMYRLGDKVRVRCISASKENSMIDFELVNKSVEGGKEENGDKE